MPPRHIAASSLPTVGTSHCMPRDELRHEITSGVRFWGLEEGGKLIGVMGIQDVQDVTLIRHAYFRAANRHGGIGGKLLGELRKLTTRPVLIGTWATATWAIRFYAKHGFRAVTPEEKDRLLKKYWSIPEWQVETSVVLGDERYLVLPSRRASSGHRGSSGSGAGF